MNKVGYILSYVGGGIIILWGLWLLAGYIPLEYFRKEVHGESAPIVIFKLVTGTAVIRGATWMRTTASALKGSWFVVFFSLLNGNMLAAIGGILGLLDYWRNKRQSSS